ncbi:gastrin-releasing peptide-like [Suncus etruscus]|uniref:gastrin-releasing peptide-like n=1 Tax=Suncus etruscus TaxID=109475 RepID=UPI00210F5319|nr:gastrin-releasing peptide-like [Suncus etruscus]
MRAPELPLVLLALLLGQAPRGPAAPVPGPGGPALTKMYPRGNHWAVGHLMGKKSTGELPDISEWGIPKEQQEIWEYLAWEASARNLLSFLKAQETRGHHRSPQPEPLSSHQATPWDVEEQGSFQGVSEQPKGRMHVLGRG